MGYNPGESGRNGEEMALLLSTDDNVPKDSYHQAYLIYFILGAGFLLPWNAFITAVDYFSYLYPGYSIDRVFAVTYMLVAFVCLIVIIGWAHKSSAWLRINLGLALFLISLLLVPIMDLVYIKGRTNLNAGYYVTVAAVALSGIADALVQGGVIGSAGELPERYMQATVAGTAASGVVVSLMRLLTKAIYPQDGHGLRQSANLYFGVSVAFMAVCIICHNAVGKLPIIQFYRRLKSRAGKEVTSILDVPSWRSTMRSIVGSIKWFCFGISLIYVVTLSIFPGYITEDVHSQVLKDWYPILLITCYNVFDLVGKTLPVIYIIENATVAVSACITRLLFYPLFFACLHGPKPFRTEIPVILLTCVLGLSNGYFTAVLMILAPKAVPLQHSEIAGIVIVFFLLVGLALGSVIAWFWVI